MCAQDTASQKTAVARNGKKQNFNEIQETATLIRTCCHRKGAT